MRYAEAPLVDETALRHGVLEVANLYGRYGYRTVCGLLRDAGWQTSDLKKIKLAFEQTRDTCNACHKEFRKK